MRVTVHEIVFNRIAIGAAVIHNVVALVKGDLIVYRASRFRFKSNSEQEKGYYLSCWAGFLTMLSV